MAFFELNIYGNNDEIIKSFETDKVRWGVYLQATELQGKIKNESPAEQFKAIGQFVKKIFPDLTDADLENADAEDVFNTFKQLISKANAINGVKKENVESEEGKNA